MDAMIESRPDTLGYLLRDWRRRRRMSQLDLALEADISSRHLSFVETGRSRPSREMVLRLAEHLGVPLRQRNGLLLAAGYAPAFPERRYDDPELAEARQAIERVLKGHEPYPALAIDRHWTMLSRNAPAARLLDLVSPALLEPPVNLLRLGLHPDGLARFILNLPEWKAHLLDRLRSQALASGDPALEALQAELEAYPAGADRPATEAGGGIFVPLLLDIGGLRLSLLSTVTIFGTPIDITLSEIAIESFFPADQATAEALRNM